MTREQLDALEAEFAHRSDATALHVAKTIAMARESLELREALEEALDFAARGNVSIYRTRSYPERTEE